MSMLYVKIINEKNKTVELEDLTAIGRKMVFDDCEELINRIDEIQSEED